MGTENVSAGASGDAELITSAEDTSGMTKARPAPTGPGLADGPDSGTTVRRCGPPTQAIPESGWAGPGKPAEFLSGLVAVFSASPERCDRRLLRSGVTYVPQGNRVFGDLSVREDLEMGGITLPNKKELNGRIERAFVLFPALKPRLRQRAGTLSGGEKQVLALANALILSPRLLLLDEPSLGLAPPLVSEALARIQQTSRDSQVAVLIVEQKVREVLKIARRVYVLRNGVVSFAGPADSLTDEAKLREAYL